MNMPRRLRVVPVFLLLAVSSAGAAEKPRIDVEEFALPNGMRWLLFETHASPTIAAGWVAHVGSVNERPGITGLSHFFEHMMFKGTRTLGTKDIAQDLQIIEEQEKVRAAMREEMEVMRGRLRRGEIDDVMKPENQTPRFRELEKEFDALVQKQRAIIVKDQLDQIYTSNGGENMNAGTSEDWTVYFIRLPSNRLELWAWLESDRLMNPVFREFYSERDVVYEERRMRTESTPLGKFNEAFNAVFWEASPYGWPVVGWASDIPSYTKEQADQYFATYYAPNNLTGVLVGDFQTAEAKPVLERYFGRLARGQTAPPPVVTLEPKQVAEKRFHAEAETSPTVRVWWKGLPFVHRDRTVADLLTDVLAGRTGRLYKGLVLGRQIANDVQAGEDPRKYGGIIQVEAVVKDGQDPAAVEQALYEEIEKLKNEPVPPAELQKVKNQAKASVYRALASPMSILFQLMVYDGLGDWEYINKYADEVEAVTAADLQRAATAYFTKENRTVGIFLRKEGAAPEDPEIAALPAPAQGMVKQSLARINAETDAAQLREGIARMQQSAAQAPPEMKAAIDLMVKRAQERLAALESQK